MEIAMRVVLSTRHQFSARSPIFYEKRCFFVRPAAKRAGKAAFSYVPGISHRMGAISVANSLLMEIAASGGQLDHIFTDLFCHL
jgi:hypothetical protein